MQDCGTLADRRLEGLHVSGRRFHVSGRPVPGLVLMPGAAVDHMCASHALLLHRSLQALSNALTTELHRSTPTIHVHTCAYASTPVRIDRLPGLNEDVLTLLVTFLLKFPPPKC